MSLDHETRTITHYCSLLLRVEKTAMVKRNPMKNLIFIALAALPFLGQAEPLQVRVVDVEGKPVGNAVIYLQNHETAAMPHEPHNHEIEQGDKKFAPYVSVVRKQEEIVFTNHDDITHHVYSFNAPARFDFRLELPASSDPNSLRGYASSSPKDWARAVPSRRAWPNGHLTSRLRSWRCHCASSAHCTR